MASDDVVNPSPELRPIARVASAKGILASPSRPSFCRTCPACGKWFALKLLQSRQHPVVGRVTTYRCKTCGHEVEYAQNRPADTI